MVVATHTMTPQPACSEERRPKRMETKAAYLSFQTARRSGSVQPETQACRPLCQLLPPCLVLHPPVCDVKGLEVAPCLDWAGPSCTLHPYSTASKDWERFVEELVCGIACSLQRGQCKGSSVHSSVSRGRLVQRGTPDFAAYGEEEGPPGGGSIV